MVPPRRLAPRAFTSAKWRACSLKLRKLVETVRHVSATRTYRIWLCLRDSKKSRALGSLLMTSDGSSWIGLKVTEIATSFNH